jgi:hypothetical protein
VHGFAACKTKQCNPGLRVCGNKLDTTVDQTKFFSECVSTPDGYKWVTTRCDGYLTCHSSAGVACSSDCLQGQTQCSGAGLVTCGADGTWGVALSCGTQTCGTDSVTGVSRCADVGCEAGQKGVCVDPGQVRLCTNGTLGAPQALVCATGACDHGECKPQCVDGTSNCATLPTGEIGVVTCASGRLPKTLGEVCSSPVTGANRTCVTVSTTKAVCVDLECQTASGLCTSDGKLRVCVDGKLAAVGAAVACPAGEVCVGTACVAADCQAGETKCAGAPLMNAYRSCQAGVFTNSVTFCPTAADAGTGLQSCIDSRDASNLRKALCGLECSPGARKCEIAPSDAGVPPSLLRVCDANGKWGAATACAYGQCAGAEPSAGCQADCLPGDLHCGGTASLHPDLRIPVTNGTQACLASGTWSPTITTCATGQYCRVDPNGVAYGCVECVGSSNQSGAVDLRCAVPDDAGVASAIQECTAGNQWPPTSVSCNGACHSPSGVQPAYCATSGGGTCLGCAQTTCGAYRTACLADPTCVTSFENCLATNHCWDPAAAFFTCVHNCAYYIDQTTSDYHNCLTHMAPPTGCSGGGMCNQN